MKQDYQFFIYILASDSWVLYIGMTNNLVRRIQEHREWFIEGFTKKYKCYKLVYFESTKYVHNAINREKELKHFLRKEKVDLIESMNPWWKDLYQEILI